MKRTPRAIGKILWVTPERSKYSRKREKEGGRDWRKERVRERDHVGNLKLKQRTSKRNMQVGKKSTVSSVIYLITSYQIVNYLLRMN